MSSKSDVRFVIETEGEKRTLFDVRERKSDDLLIIRKTAGRLRPFHTHENGAEIANEKYSVHMSSNSPDRINLIKVTKELKDEENIVATHYTKAIKQKNCFAPLFFQRSTDLTLQETLSKSETNSVVKLGSYKPSDFVLYFYVLVGGSERRFELRNSPYFNVKQVSFRSFSVVLLWTFGLGISDHTGATTFQLTVPDDVFTARDELVEYTTQNGLDEEGCSEMMANHCRRLQDEQFSILAKAGFDIAAVWEMARAFGFVKNGHHNSRAYTHRIVSRQVILRKFA